MKRTGRRKHASIRLRLNHLRQDHGNGWLGAISRLIAAAKDALPAVELTINKTEEEATTTDGSPSVVERRNESLETEVREDVDRVLEEESTVVESKALAKSKDDPGESPVDLGEIAQADAELVEKIRELRECGWEVRFERSPKRQG